MTLALLGPQFMALPVWRGSDKGTIATPLPFIVLGERAPCDLKLGLGPQPLGAGPSACGHVGHGQRPPPAYLPLPSCPSSNRLLRPDAQSPARKQKSPVKSHFPSSWASCRLRLCWGWRTQTKCHRLCPKGEAGVGRQVHTQLHCGSDLPLPP